MLAATVVATTIAGCGGSSVSGSQGSPSASLPGGSSSPLTNLGSLGYIETSYLTGAARDGGSVTVNLSLADFTDDQHNRVSVVSGSKLGLQVDAYGGPQVFRTPITFGSSSVSGVPNTDPFSRKFTTYQFQFDNLTSTGLPGGSVLPADTFLVTGGNITTDELTPNPLVSNAATANPFNSPTFSSYQNGLVYAANIRAFPGRFSSITVRVDPNTIGLNYQTENNDPTTGVNYSSGTPRGVFELDQFNSINFADPTVQTFQGVVSDYLSFDISHLATASKPTLTQNAVTVTAQRVFFSGDTYGIADGTGSGNFFQLTKDISGTNAAIGGTFNTNSGVGSYAPPSSVSGFLPGTYALNQIDPSDPSFLRKILSLQGMFFDSDRMINYASNTYAVTFPSSNDDKVQDFVLIHKASSGANAGKIVDLLYGYVDYEAREFYIYPINTIVNAQSNTYFHGTISPTTLFDGSGKVTSDQRAIRSGVFTLDSPYTFSDSSSLKTGTFIVYRR